jgi:hypothetical protein
VGRDHILLLGWLHLRRRRARLLLLLGRHGLARDESSDPSEGLDVLRRSSQPSRLTSNTPEAVCSTSGALGPAPVPAEGWMAETDGLAGSSASGGVDAWAVVASAPADRFLSMWSVDSSMRWAPNYWWKSGPKVDADITAPLNAPRRSLLPRGYSNYPKRGKEMQNY